MDTFNRFFGRLAWGAITVLGFLFLLNIGLSLLSAPANLDVMAGVVLILFAIYLGGVSLTSLFKTFGRKAAILLLMLPLLSACTIISPGYAGVKVNQWGDDKGVASAPLVTGRVVYNPISTSEGRGADLQLQGRHEDHGRLLPRLPAEGGEGAGVLREVPHG
jgi:hypothetical protein